MYKQFYMSHLQQAKRVKEEIHGLCRFHDDKEPSFWSNINTGVAYCFG